MGGKIVTAAEFEKLSPAEQDAAFEASIITDLDDAPQDVLAEVRARLLERIAAEEASDVG